MGLWLSQNRGGARKKRHPVCDSSVSSDSSDKTQKQIVKKNRRKKWQLKNSKCDNSNGNKCQKLKLWSNSKTQIVAQLKNLNCDKFQILKLWQNSNFDRTLTRIVTKLKLKLWPNSNFDPTQKLKLWDLKYSNCDNSNFDSTR